MSLTLDAAPFVNPFDPAVQADPEPVFAALRARSAVVRTPLGATVLRRESVHRLLGDPRLLSAASLFASDQTGGVLQLEDTILAKDGPDHTRLRRLVARSFTPRAADSHRATMQALTNALVDTFDRRGSCEFITEFADHYPIEVMCDVLGVPRDDHPRFARWGDTLTRLLSLELSSHLEDVARAGDELGAYVDSLVEERRVAPRADLVTELVQATTDGDRLSGAELRTMIGALIFAGYDTRNQLGHAVLQFALHADQWSLRAERPELAGRAVEEAMRLHGAVVGVPRLTVEEIDVDGWAIPAGTLVSLSLASANRDATYFDDPLRFDITVERPPHLTFGSGPHYCLGANLARAEMEEALLILSRRMPDLRLAGSVEWRTDTAISGPRCLPLAFEPQLSTRGQRPGRTTHRSTVATVKSVERQIHRVEGFNVRIRYAGPGPVKRRDVRSDRRSVPGYPYRRRRSDAHSVAEWAEGRFHRAYRGYEVDVLDGRGQPVHRRTLLRTVRATYD